MQSRELTREEIKKRILRKVNSTTYLNPLKGRLLTLDGAASIQVDDNEETP